MLGQHLSLDRLMVLVWLALLMGLVWLAPLMELVWLALLMELVWFLELAVLCQANSHNCCVRKRSLQ
jgi:hypothetical protein